MYPFQSRPPLRRIWSLWVRGNRVTEWGDGAGGVWSGL